MCRSFYVVKVRLQHDAALKGRPLPVAVFHVFRDEGARGAWRGLPPRLIWSVPLAAATFTYYQVLKQNVDGSSDSRPERSKSGPPAASGSAGGAGGGSGWTSRTTLAGPVVLAASVALRTPFDIIEQQLQLRSAQQQAATGVVQGPPSPAEVSRRLRALWAAEGPRGVWRGYPAAFCGIFAYVAGYFVTYEAARRTLERTRMADHPTLIHVTSGGLGGGLTAAIATPIDTVKVRMQTKIYATAAEPHPSALTVLRRTVGEAGLASLWRGVAARVASNAPSGAIMFAVYEWGHRWIERNLARD